MARRRLSEGQKWQIIGMKNAGLSCRDIGTRLGVNHTVISRLVQKHGLTGQVKDRPRSGRPRKTSARDDRALVYMSNRHPMAGSRYLRQHWNAGVRASTSTVRRRLKAVGLRARRPIRRPFLTPRHMQERLTWSRMRARWNLRSWGRIHWSDESRFLLHMADGRVRVWRYPNTRYAPQNIATTVPGGGGLVMVWGCISYDCRLDLITIPGTLNAQRYQENVLEPHVVPHFEDHTLASRPIFMDDNATPHRARVVKDYLQATAIETLPWPARSPDLNPIEHLWDILGRQMRSRDPPVQNLQELTQALHEEWQRIPMFKIRRLIISMGRRVQTVIRAGGGYTRY